MRGGGMGRPSTESIEEAVADDGSWRGDVGRGEEGRGGKFRWPLPSWIRRKRIPASSC